MSQVFHIQELHTCNCTFKKKKKILFYDVTGKNCTHVTAHFKKKILFYDVTGIPHSRIAHM